MEVTAIIGLAGASALWRMAFTQGSMKRGMEAILHEVQLLRSDVGKDIVSLKEDVKDHEMRIRQLETTTKGRR